MKNQDEEYVTVPLIVYQDGVGIVIGEATVSIEQIRKVAGPDQGENIIQKVFSDKTAMYLDVSRSDFEFRTPLKKTET